jgi:hypothetical protein
MIKSSRECFSIHATGFKCTGQMNLETHLGENSRQIEVSDDQATPYLFR